MLNTNQYSSMADIQAISVKDLPVESKPLFVPPLEEISKCTKTYLIVTKILVNIIFLWHDVTIILDILVLQNGLSKDFVHAEVKVVECPDLTEQPFNIASKGTNYTHKSY